MFLQEKKKTFTLSPWKRVFFSPARKLGGLYRVVTAPDRCLCIRIQQKFCLDCFHEYLIMVVTAARRMTTLGQLWDDFGTSLSVFHCSYLVVTATRTMSKKTRAPAPPAPITCSRWNRLLVSPLFFIITSLFVSCPAILSWLTWIKVSFACKWKTLFWDLFYYYLIFIGLESEGELTYLPPRSSYVQ